MTSSSGTSPISDSEINTAPDHVVRATLVAICRRDPSLRARVSEVFRLALSAGHNKRKAEDGEPVGTQELPEARRQKLDEDLKVCIMCEKPYLASQNHRKACFHHPDEAEIDEDSPIWDDYPDEFMERDIEENRKEYPEAFIYMCCDKNLTTSGCRWGRHYSSVEDRDNDPQAHDPASDAVVEISN